MRKLLAIAAALVGASAPSFVSAHSQASDGFVGPDLIVEATVFAEVTTQFAIEILTEEGFEIIWRSDQIGNVINVEADGFATFRVQFHPDTPKTKLYVCTRSAYVLRDGQFVVPGLQTRICSTFDLRGVQ